MLHSFVSIQMFRIVALRSAASTRPSCRMALSSLPSEEAKEPPKEKEKPKFNYKTFDQFQKEGGHSSMRNSHGPGFSNVTPTPSERKYLVWMRMYKSDKDIPDTVSMQTLQHMRDRRRVVIAVLTTVFFFFFFVTAHDLLNPSKPQDRRKF